MLRPALSSMFALALLVAAAAMTSMACASEAAPASPEVASVIYELTEDGDLLRWGSSPEPELVVAGLLPPSTAREFALDATSGLLWYSENHARIESIDIATREPGPSLGGFSDVGLVGCAVSGRPRTIAIDEGRRLLLVPQLTGGVLEYRLDDLGLEDVVSASMFGEATLGAFRRIAVAPDGYLWFVSADGSLVEVDRASGPTGRRLSLEDRDGGAPFARTPSGGLVALD
ncbi:MAG: hypothetical protein R3C39_13100 [Dehalococcoidia bacterium]